MKLKGVTVMNAKTKKILCIVAPSTIFGPLKLIGKLKEMKLSPSN